MKKKLLLMMPRMMLLKLNNRLVRIRGAVSENVLTFLRALTRKLSSFPVPNFSWKRLAAVHRVMKEETATLPIWNQDKVRLGKVMMIST